MKFIEVYHQDQVEPICINLGQVIRVDRAIVGDRPAVSLLMSNNSRVIVYTTYDYFLTKYLGFYGDDLLRPVPTATISPTE